MSVCAPSSSWSDVATMKKLNSVKVLCDLGILLAAAPLWWEPAWMAAWKAGPEPAHSPDTVGRWSDL